MISTPAGAILVTPGKSELLSFTEHTIQNFRKRIWIPHIFERRKTKDPKEMLDPVAKAYERWNHIVGRTEPYHLPEDRSREIDCIFAMAERDIMNRA
jgi:hypothetical protein